jgi:hypothetical protein
MTVRPTHSAGLAPPRPARALAGIVALAAAALAVAGVVLAIGIVRTGAPQPTPLALPPGPFGTAQDIPTSFGVVAVEHAEKLAGPTAKALSGVTHGVGNLVPPNRVQVQASVTLTNLLEHPVAYSPTQFRLLVGPKRRPVRTLRSNLRPGTLQPDASIDGRLVFVVPRNGAALWVEYTDPGRAKPILIDLGRTGRTPPGALDRYRAHNHG